MRKIVSARSHHNVTQLYVHLVFITIPSRADEWVPVHATPSFGINLSSEQLESLVLHRHINPKGWTLVAIDDVIGNGGLEDWLDLSDTVRVDPTLLSAIKQVADHGAIHGEDIDAYRFWQAYVEHKMGSRSGS